MRRVLVVGMHDDPHVIAVCNAIAKGGVQSLIFDTAVDKLSLNTHDGITDGHLVCMDAPDLVPIEDIACGWYRHKRMWIEGNASLSARSEARFAWDEWGEILVGLRSVVAPGRWVNPMSADRGLATKVAQHKLAAEVGFRVPRSVVGNDPDAARAMFDECHRVIYKPNRMPQLSHVRSLYTTEIEREFLDGRDAEIKKAPGIYQELIEKEYELRVTVVGDTLFTARIESQKDPSTELDWRRNQDRPGLFKKAALPDTVAEKLRTFHSQTGLIYGAYDLIVTKEGEYVFLEVNPSGQWLWLEEALGLPVSEKLAEYLIELASRPSEEHSSSGKVCETQ